MLRPRSTARHGLASLALVAYAAASCSVDERVLRRKTIASTGSFAHGGEGTDGAGEGGIASVGPLPGADAGAAGEVDGGADTGGAAGGPSAGSGTSGAGSSGGGGSFGGGGSGNGGSSGSGGSGGEPFVSPCGDLNQNRVDDCEETLVQNSRFNTDASGWSVEGNVQQAWSATNGTSASGSGSVSLINNNVMPGSAGTTGAGTRQCLTGFGKEKFDVAARVYLREGQGEGRAAISIVTYGHDECQGTLLETFTVGPAVAAGEWQVVAGTVQMPPAARSFWVRLIVSKPLAEPSFEALVDDVLIVKRP